MRILMFLFWLFLFVVFVLFAVLNMHPVELNFYLYRTGQVPLFIVVIVSVLFGALLSSLYYLLDYLKLKYRLREKDKTIKDLNKRLSELEVLIQRKTEQVEKMDEKSSGGVVKDEGGTGESLQS